MKTNYLLNVYYQFLVNIEFSLTSLIQKMIGFRNYFFKKQHSSKSDYKNQIENCLYHGFNEDSNCFHDCNHIGFLDENNVVDDANYSGNNQIPFKIVSNRTDLVHNNNMALSTEKPMAKPLVSKNHPTISLKDVYENLVRSNIAKLKTSQLFENLYGVRHRRNDNNSNRFVVDNNSEADASLESYPIHHLENRLLDKSDKKLDSQKNIVESQNLDKVNHFSSSANENVNEQKYLLDTFNYSNNCLDNDELELEQETTANTTSKTSKTASQTDASRLNAAAQLKQHVNNSDCHDIAIHALELNSESGESSSASDVDTLESVLETKSSTNVTINDIEQEQIVIEECSEEMKTIVSNFSLNLKSVTDNNPIELTVQHQLFSVSYEKNPYFSINDTPHIEYNSLMELEQDAELIVFPLCFYIQHWTAPASTNHKLIFVLEEQIDEDNELSLDYVNNVHSGRIGLIYASKNNIRKHYNVKRITQKIQDDVKFEAIKFVQLLNQ